MASYPPATAVGGPWSACDRFNREFNGQASAPPNLLKSLVNRESSCDWEANSRPVKLPGRPTEMVPFTGIYRSTAEGWGCDFPAMVGSPGRQIACMAVGLARLADAYGGFERAVLVYHGGPNALEDGFCDEHGLCSDDYQRRAVADWRALDQISMANPTIYDIRRDADAERFGLSPVERNALIGYRIPNRDGYRPRWIVLHIQDGNTAGSLDWWVNGWVDGKKVLASANIMANRDGSLLRVVNDSDGPWTNGDVQSPTAIGRTIQAEGGGDPNRVSLTIEAEGRAGERLTPAQLAAIVWQVRRWMDAYGIPIERVIGHYEINTVTRSHCGRYVPEIRAALGQPAPTPPSGYAAGGAVPSERCAYAEVNGVPFWYVPLTYTVVRANTPRRQYAELRSKPTGADLWAGATFDGLWVVHGEPVEGLREWAVTEWGSRIPMAYLSPRVTITR